MNWTLFGIVFSLSGLILPLFITAGQAARPEIKKKIGKWLSNELPKEDGVRFWADSFIKFFDDLFGERMFSLRRISVSALISVCMAVLFLGLQILVTSEYAGTDKLPENTSILRELIHRYAGIKEFAKASAFFIAVFITNIIGDYLSLEESRFVLSRIIRAKKSWYIPILILLDALFTWICFSTVCFLVFVAFHKGLDVEKAEEISFPLFSLEQKRYITMWPILFTSYMTSVWLYIYVIGAGFIKLQYSIRKGNSKIYGLFDVKEKPFTSLAVVSSTYIFLIGLIFSLLF